MNEIEQALYFEAKKKWEFQAYTLGRQFHSQRIPYVQGSKEYVRMYCNADFDTVISLYSEPFETKEEAQHFADCFFDSFLYEAKVKCENGKYVVNTDWLDKRFFLSYQKKDQHYLYYLFANWS